MTRHTLLLEAARRGKYAKLFDHLQRYEGSECPTTFTEVEGILGFRLPVSARVHRPWWANNNKSGHSQSIAWTMAGWKTTAVDLDAETLTFRKAEDMHAISDRPAQAAQVWGRKTPPTMDDFRTELTAHFMWAKSKGMEAITIKAGDLHRSVGGYPTPFNRMTMCCKAMYDEQRVSDRIISAPPKGQGASLTIKYQLPRH